MLRKRSNSAKGNSRWDFKTVLLESFFIVVALLLALWLNNWNNERNNQQLVEKVIVSSTQEIAENLEIINETIEYRRELLRNIRAGTHEIERFKNFAEVTGVDFFNKRELSSFLDDLFLREGNLDLLGKELFDHHEHGYLMDFYGNSARLVLDGSDLVVYGFGNIQLRIAPLKDVAWNTAKISNSLVHMDYETLSDLSEVYATQERYNETSSQTLTLLYTRINMLSAMEDMFWIENDLKSKYEAFLSSY